MARTAWTDKKFFRDSSKYQLDRNENCDSDVVGLARQFLNELPAASFTRYPNMGRAYEHVETLGLDPRRVLLTNGAEDGIRSILYAHRDRGSIAFPDPTYGMVPVLSDIFGLAKTAVPYSCEFQIDIHKLSAGIIYIANPDNPTGTAVELEDIIALCDTGSIVIVDETYFEFYGATAVYLVGMYPNLYIVRSFSKGYAAAGVRLGMIISSPENILRLTENKPAYEVSAIACEYLGFVARHQDKFKESCGRVLSGKHLLNEALISGGYKVRATHTNFTLVEYDEYLLKQVSAFAAVKVVNISGSRFIRITSPDVLLTMNIVNRLGEQDARVNHSAR